MFRLSDKAKQFLLAAAKVLVVALAFWFIYSRLSDNTPEEKAFFREKLESELTLFSVVILFALSFFNRFFEILKWQNLVSSFKTISVGEASKQVLAALTLSIFTPNGIGEYGAKALYYPKDKTKKIIFLNLLCNGIQLVITVVFGILGLIYFNAHYNVVSAKVIFYSLLVLCVIFILGFALKKINIGRYSIDKLTKKVTKMPRPIHLKNGALAILRYAVFAHQYYFLFVLFGVDLPYLLLMAIIASMYFLASSLPTLQFFDFAVKGSVAVYFFSLAGVNEWIPVFIATIMWLLNVALPVVIGSYFVIRFRPQWK